MLDRVSDFLAERTPREKLLLAVGSLVVFGWIGFSFVAEPLVGGGVRVEEELREKRALLSWITEGAERMNALGQGAQRTIVAKGASEVQENLTQRGLARYLTLIEPKPEGIVLLFENADARLATNWLLGVESELGYRVDNAGLIRREVDGFADVEVLLVPVAR